MQPGDAVGALTQTEAHDGHVEPAGIPTLVILRAQRQHPIQGQRPEARELVADHLTREPVDAGGDGGVGGEDVARAGALDGGGVLVAVVHVLADSLQPQETRVALVGVVDARGGGFGDPAVGTERADPADAQQDLLGHPVFGAAAVEPIGDLAVRGAVDVEIGVHHQQRHPADLGHPDARVEGMIIKRHVDDDGLTGLGQQRQRQRVGIQQRVTLLLVPVGVQRLTEIAVAIHEADADDRHAEIARGLEVVSGENPQAARVLRQHVGHAELGGKVADGLGGLRVLRTVPLVPELGGEVLVQIVAEPLDVAHETAVLSQVLQPLRVDARQHRPRILVDGVPQDGIDRPQQLAGFVMPRPAQVEG